MPTYQEVVREYFPGASDDYVDYILWEKTGFPEFWDIPKDGATPEECLRKQLQDLKDGVSHPNRRREWKN